MSPYGDNQTDRHEDRLYACARWGCHAINRPHTSYGAAGRSWCLGHKPGRVQRLLLRILRPAHRWSP